MNLNAISWFQTLLSNSTCTATASYGEGVTEIERSIAKRAGKPVADDTGPSKCIEPGFNFKDVRLEGNKWMNLTDAEVGGYVQVE